VHCEYCERRTYPRGRKERGLDTTSDHVAPKWNGGTGDVPNRARCCRACNELKGDMSPAQWTRFMSENPGWWAMFYQTGLRGLRLFAQVVEKVG